MLILFPHKLSRRERMAWLFTFAWLALAITINCVLIYCGQ